MRYAHDKPGVGVEKNMVPDRGPTLISPYLFVVFADSSWPPVGDLTVFRSTPGFCAPSALGARGYSKCRPVGANRGIARSLD